MKGNFAAALKTVLGFEGGYVNNPKDPGGATNMGVTQRVYTAWRQARGLPAQEVRQISSGEVATIYRNEYANPVRFDDLPSGVDLIVFDGAVNSGVSRSVKWLQKAVRVTQDGQIGPMTLSAARSMDSASIINSIADTRLSFLQGLRTWSTFGRGWKSRVVQVRGTALMQAHLENRTLSRNTTASETVSDIIAKRVSSPHTSPLRAILDFLLRMSGQRNGASPAKA